MAEAAEGPRVGHDEGHGADARPAVSDPQTRLVSVFRHRPHGGDGEGQLGGFGRLTALPTGGGGDTPLHRQGHGLAPRFLHRAGQSRGAQGRLSVDLYDHVLHFQSRVTGGIDVATPAPC